MAKCNQCQYALEQSTGSPAAVIEMFCVQQLTFWQLQCVTVRSCRPVRKGAADEEKWCSLNPPMKNKDFPPRRKCLRAGKDIKALYYHYNSTALSLTLSVLYHLQIWLCFRHIFHCGCILRIDIKFTLKRNVYVVNVILGGPSDVNQRGQTVISTNI